MVFHLYQDVAGNWRWYLSTASGVKLAVSPVGYARRMEALQAIHRVREENRRRALDGGRPIRGRRILGCWLTVAARPERQPTPCAHTSFCVHVHFIPLRSALACRLVRRAPARRNGTAWREEAMRVDSTRAGVSVELLIAQRAEANQPPRNFLSPPPNSSCSSRRPRRGSPAARRPARA